MTKFCFWNKIFKVNKVIGREVKWDKVLLSKKYLRLFILVSVSHVFMWVKWLSKISAMRHVTFKKEYVDLIVLQCNVSLPLRRNLYDSLLSPPSHMEMQVLWSILYLGRIITYQYLRIAWADLWSKPFTDETGTWITEEPSWYLIPWLWAHSYFHHLTLIMHGNMLIVPIQHGSDFHSLLTSALFIQESWKGQMWTSNNKISWLF